MSLVHSSPPVPLIYMTGTNGYVGRTLLSFFEAKSLTVRRLERGENDDWSITSNPPSSTGQKAERGYLIHLAVPSKRANRGVWDRYHRNSSDLFYRSHLAGLTVVQVSSLSAHAGNPSLYSEQKKVSEALAKDHGGIVVRLGVVETEAKGSPHRRLIGLQTVLPVQYFLAPGVTLMITTHSMLRQFAEDVVAKKISGDSDRSYSTPIFPGPQRYSVGRRLASGPISGALSVSRSAFPELEILERATNFYFGMRDPQLEQGSPAPLAGLEKDILRRGVRFFVVGTVNTVLYSILFFTMICAGAALALANAVSFAISALSSYAMNSGYVFRTKSSRLGALIFLVTLTALMAAIGFLGSVLGLGPWQVLAQTTLLNVVATLLFFHFQPKKRKRADDS